MKIVMIRHFQTMGNRRGCYIGRTDEPLLGNGELAKLVLKRQESLKEMSGTECIIVSPMKRCIQTAGLLFPGRETICCREMRECDFGDFEGKNYEELKNAAAYKEWLDSGGTLPFPGGEDHERFKGRCVKGFERMIARLIQNRCTRAAMVVHGGTIMAILSRFDSEGRGFYDFQIENGGGYVISLDERIWVQRRKEFGEIRRL